MFNKFKIGRPSGFTLIEILIVISIISFFSAFLVVNFRSNEKLKEVKNQALVVVDGLKRVQTMALTGEKVEEIYPLRYIFSINKCSDGNCYYGIKRDDVDRDPFETVDLKNMVVEIMDGNGRSVQSLDASFLPPRANIKLLAGGITEEATIKLIHIKDDNLTRCIKINSISGRIDVLTCSQ